MTDDALEDTMPSAGDAMEVENAADSDAEEPSTQNSSDEPPPRLMITKMVRRRRVLSL